MKGFMKNRVALYVFYGIILLISKAIFGFELMVLISLAFIIGEQTYRNK
jgi:hypothetical protein